VNRLPVEGESFGRYRLLRKLGQGGMGVVYAAQDTTLNREVALKLVVPHLAGDDGFRARFQREAEVLARLDSPRIVKIFDHGEHDDMLYLVTQLVAGGDLHKLIQREGALPPALATSVLTQVVEGLCDAHAVSVVHRDIKPANVLLRERGRDLEAFLCDFGIATTPGAELSRTGTIAGSLPYMAPERHRGEDAGPQGDVYAAGCLLWHALTGSAPYAGTDVEVAMAHLRAPLPQLPGKDPFSRRANEVIARAMAKDRRKRYPTARALLTDLQALAPLAPDVISLPGATAIRQALPPEQPRRWRAALVAVAAVLVVLATTAVGWSALRDGAPETAEPPSGPFTVTESRSAGPLVGETRTLLPRPVRTTKNGEVVTVVPELLPGLPTLPAGPAEPTRKAGAGGGGGSSPSQAPRPTAGPTFTPPTYRYQCWDGTKVVQESSCSTYPTGSRAYPWIFTKYPRLSGCRGYDHPDSTRDVEGRMCRITYADGETTFIAFLRWSTRSDARAHFRGWFNKNFNFTEQPWVINATTYGTHMYGRGGSRGRLFRSVRFYTASGTQPWSFSVSASTVGRRDHAVDLARGFVSPYRFRAKPL